MSSKVPELAGYATLRRAPRASRTNRIDLVLEGNGLRTCYIVVENVTLEKDGIAYFPDSKNTKGIEVIQNLTNLIREGNRGMVIFVAQRADVESIELANHIDGEYCEAFRDAVARGVETLGFRARVTRKAIEFEKSLVTSVAA